MFLSQEQLVRDMFGVVGDSRCLGRQLVDSLVRVGDKRLDGLAKLRDKNCSRARIIVCWRAVRIEELGG